MLLRKWKYHITSAVFSFLCITVLFKKNVKGDTYGDLGDEIIVDYPTQPTRKNEIPQGRDADGKGHKIDQRTIMQKTVSHYKNPLFYREFTPRSRARVARGPLRSDARKLNAKTWRKKDYIHRPMVNKQRIPNYVHAPIVTRYPESQLYPRTLGITVRRKQTNPRVMIPRREYRPSVVLKPRVFSHPVASDGKKMKHHLHVQIIPKAPLNPVRAQKMGIHSGFVLLPVTQSRGNPITQRRTMQQKLKREREVRTNGKSVSNRFSERKHIWIPSRRMNAHDVPVQEMTSYHVDDIGNLIPDNQQQQAATKRTISPLVKDLENVAMRWAKDSPPLRKTMKSNPRWMDALQGAVKPKHIISVAPRKQVRVARPPARRTITRVKLLPRQRILTKKPLIVRSHPQSSRRILYFAHNAPPSKRVNTPSVRYRSPRVDPKAYPSASRYINKRQRTPSAEQARLINFIERVEDSLGPPIISKEYIIPRVSPNVYRYIHDKTVPSSVTPGTKNPLLRYLQYHRVHPSKRNQHGSPVVNSARGLTRRRVSNMQHGRRKTMLSHTRRKRKLGSLKPSLTSGRERRAISQVQYGYRRIYPGQYRQPLPISALFRQNPSYRPGMSLKANNRGKLPWNYYHNEVMPDGRIRPALYPISHHIPPGKCLPDGNLCDEGHDEQCCGRSAFCQNYWGISKCVAYSKVTMADMHNPYQIQQNRVYKHYYRYMLSKVELK